MDRKRGFDEENQNKNGNRRNRNDHHPVRDLSGKNIRTYPGRAVHHKSQRKKAYDHCEEEVIRPEYQREFVYTIEEQVEAATNRPTYPIRSFLIGKRPINVT